MRNNALLPEGRLLDRLVFQWQRAICDCWSQQNQERMYQAREH